MSTPSSATLSLTPPQYHQPIFTWPPPGPPQSFLQFNEIASQQQFHGPNFAGHLIHPNPAPIPNLRIPNNTHRLEGYAVPHSIEVHEQPTFNFMGEPEAEGIIPVRPFSYDEVSETSDGRSSTQDLELREQSPTSANSKRKPTPRRHACTMCTRAFDRPSTLKKHLLVHTGEKAFACPTCDRRFSIASNRNRHIPRCPVGSDAQSTMHKTFLMYTPHEGNKGLGASLGVSTQDTQVEVHPPRHPDFAYYVDQPLYPPLPPRKKRDRRAPSPVNWIPESLRGFKITSMRAYVKSYNRKMSELAKVQRMQALDEKHAKDVQRLEAIRRDLRKTDPPALPVTSKIHIDKHTIPEVTLSPSTSIIEQMGQSVQPLNVGYYPSNANLTQRGHPYRTTLLQTGHSANAQPIYQPLPTIPNYGICDYVNVSTSLAATSPGSAGEEPSNGQEFSWGFGY